MDRREPELPSWMLPPVAVGRPVFAGLGTLSARAPEPTGAASGIPLAIPAWGTGRQRPGWRNEVLRSIAFALALGAHALAFAEFAPAAPDSIGGGGRELEAISVTIVASHVLDSRQAPQADKTAAATREDVAPTDGDTRPEPPKPDATEKHEEHAPPPEGLAALDKAQPDPEKAPKPPQPVKPEHTPEPTPAAGGTTARAEQAQPGQATAAAATAAPGEVRAYAHLVATALKKTRPSKGLKAGHRGTVRIIFIVAPSGGLSDLRVAQSSGDPALDAVALSAVRETRFPAPPLGMSETQLTFDIPYRFR